MVHFFLGGGGGSSTKLDVGLPPGRVAKGYMDRGELVPDDITIPIVLKALGQGGKVVFTFGNGFPFLNIPLPLLLISFL